MIVQLCDIVKNVVIHTMWFKKVHSDKDRDRDVEVVWTHEKGD